MKIPVSFQLNSVLSGTDFFDEKFMIIIASFIILLLLLLIISGRQIRKISEKLKSSDARYNDMFEKGHAIRLLFDYPDGTIVDANSAAIQFYGWPKEKFIGKRIFDIDTLPPEIVKRNLEKAISGGQNFFELRNRIASGEEKDVEAYNSSMTFENKQYVFSIIHDITEKKATQRALEESEKRYRSLIEISPDTIFIDQNDKVTFINNAGLKLFRIEDQSEIIGKSPLDFFPVEVHETIRTQRALLNSGKPTPFLELKIIHSDGSVANVEVTNAFFSFNGEDAILVLIRDITEKNNIEKAVLKLNSQLEKDLEERTKLIIENKELESFSYSISHDLKGPLGAINGLTQILIDRYSASLDENGRKICFSIIKSTKHLTLLIEDLLSLSKTTKVEMTKVEIDMNAMVSEVFDELLSSGSYPQTALNIDWLNPAVGEPVMIKQVWTNLISNAIKYSSKKEKPLIEISSSITDGMVTYRVRDNGVGFDMAQIGKLFNAFNRLHSSVDFEGTGIGLSIVQRIIVRHYGKVWAESILGEGTTFYFSLPESPAD